MTKNSQPKNRSTRSWRSKSRVHPALVVHFLLGVLCIVWLLMSQSRNWIELEATLCGRDVFRESSVEDGVTSYEYFASFEYCYGRQGRLFVGNFQENRGNQNRVLNNLEEAVQQARCRQVGDRLNVVIDRLNPAVSAHRRPGPYWWHIVGVVIYLLFFALLISEAPLILLVSGPLLLLLVSQNSSTPIAEELSLECNPVPYLKLLQAYPSLNYIPQKHIRKFNSIEKLLEVWGRPDSLSLEQGFLYLIYRGGPEWKESWRFTFAIHSDRPPTPVSAPEKLQ